MFNAANDPVYDGRSTDASAQRRQRDINMTYTNKVPPWYVFQQGAGLGVSFGYVTKYGYSRVGYASYSDAAEAAEAYSSEVER